MRKGFTLIELLVSLALFSVILLIAVGAFTNAINTQRQIAGLISAQSNASLTLEQMAREIRTGYYFCATASSTLTNQIPSAPDCAASCVIDGNPNDGNPHRWTCSVLDFYNSRGLEVKYQLGATGALERGEGGATPQPITSDNVIVRGLNFILYGNLMNDGWDPRVTIAVAVAPRSNDPAISNTVLNLQTSVSARNCGTLIGGC